MSDDVLRTDMISSEGIAEFIHVGGIDASTYDKDEVVPGSIHRDIIGIVAVNVMYVQQLPPNTDRVGNKTMIVFPHARISVEEDPITVCERLREAGCV